MLAWRVDVAVNGSDGLRVPRLGRLRPNRYTKRQARRKRLSRHRYPLQPRTFLEESFSKLPSEIGFLAKDWSTHIRMSDGSFFWARKFPRPPSFLPVRYAWFLP